MVISAMWRFAAAELGLREDQVHVWRAALDVNPAVLRQLDAALTRDERSQAARFFFPRDRNRFIAARAVLRGLLGRYLDLGPCDFELRYGPYRKPYLGPKEGAFPIRFKLSHSAGMAVFAFTYGREAGVDLEPIRTDFARDEIAEAHFSARELAELRALPPPLRAEGFFLCWTRKEAYVKAQGAGLQIPLTSFSVSLTPGHPEELQSADSARWKMSSFRPAPDHVGTVVAEGKNWHLHQWQWQFS